MKIAKGLFFFSCLCHFNCQVEIVTFNLAISNQFIKHVLGIFYFGKYNDGKDDFKQLQYKSRNKHKQHGKADKMWEYSKIFNTKYCMNTKKQNIFSRNFLYGIPMNDIYILMSEKKQRDISRIQKNEIELSKTVR